MLVLRTCKSGPEDQYFFKLGPQDLNLVDFFHTHGNCVKMKFDNLSVWQKIFEIHGSGHFLLYSHFYIWQTWFFIYRVRSWGLKIQNSVYNNPKQYHTSNSVPKCEILILKAVKGHLKFWVLRTCFSVIFRSWGSKSVLRTCNLVKTRSWGPVLGSRWV